MGECPTGGVRECPRVGEDPRESGGLSDWGIVRILGLANDY